MGKARRGLLKRIFASERGEPAAVQAEPEWTRKKPGTAVPPDPGEPESDLPSWRRDVDELLLRTLDRPQDPAAAVSAQPDGQTSKVTVRVNRHRSRPEG